MRVAMWSILNRFAEPLGVLFSLFELVDEPDLALHQGLAADGQVHEHLVELAAKPGLVGGQP